MIAGAVLHVGFGAGVSGCGAKPATPAAPPATTSSPTQNASAATTFDQPQPGPGAQRHEQEGVRVSFEMAPAQGGSGPPEDGFREGQDAIFRFTIADASSGVAVNRAHPAAWAMPRAEGESRDALAAAKAIARFIRGDRFSRPTLDLNVFYALTINDDATVTVADPRFSLGSTRLLAMVILKGNASDWALSDDQSRLYVATPSSNRVTVVDTASWSVTAMVQPIAHPTRLAIQPDGHYLWVAHDDPSGPGVAVVATEGPSLIKTLATGPGPHDIAFDGEGRYAFIADRGAGSVSAIEVHTLTKVAVIPTGPAPASVAYSPASRMVYAADATDGSITIISPATLAVVGRARAEPGIAEIRFAPGGRIGLAVNQQANAIHVLDAASGRVVQTVDTEKSPDQVTFAGTLAYVRHLDSPNVRILPLEGLGVEGRPVSVVDFPAGQNAPSFRKPEPSLAHVITPAPGDDAVLVGNPSDRTIYYYKQGMSAPLGSYSNYGRMPRAVLTVDRSLRERRPGVYETVARLGPPGDYNLAFLLDTPRIAHYFDFTTKPDPERALKGSGVTATPVTPIPGDVPAGTRVRVKFRLSDNSTGKGVAGLNDVTVLSFAPGGWQRRLRATSDDDAHQEAETGVYAVEWTPPRSGVYYLYAQSPTAGARLNRNWFLTLNVMPPSG
jgi:YVTN family beta-propeller protein